MRCFWGVGENDGDRSEQSTDRTLSEVRAEATRAEDPQVVEVLVSERRRSGTWLTRPIGVYPTVYVSSEEEDIRLAFHPEPLDVTGRLSDVISDARLHEHYDHVAPGGTTPDCTCSARHDFEHDRACPSYPAESSYRSSAAFKYIREHG